MITSIRLCMIATLIAAAAGCSSDLTKSSSPILLVASNTQTISRIDIQSGASNCSQSVGTIQLQAIIKNPNSGSTNSTFEQVHVTRYHVSYVRTDGGTQVPAPFDRSMDTLLTPGGGATSLSNFLVLQPEALLQAPFVALLPQNGGKDPDTGSPVVHMKVVVDIFGTTLAGDQVSASTSFPLDFCYACGGCA